VTTLVLGAGIYALALGVGGLTFNATPLLVGVIAITAGLAGSRPHLVVIGLTLSGWGIAVLLVREGVLPHNREAAAFLVGAAAGLAAAACWNRTHTAPATSAATALMVGALGFYFAYDIAELNHWPPWTVALALWAAVEGIRQRRRPDRGDARSPT
jgi:hypothetical protein